MMEVGPWRWDGKSEHDFYVKEGGWEEYSTLVFGMRFRRVYMNVRSEYGFSGPTRRNGLLVYEHR